MHDWVTGEEFSEFSAPLDQVGTTFVSTSRMLGFEMFRSVLAGLRLRSLRTTSRR